MSTDSKIQYIIEYEYTNENNLKVHKCFESSELSQGINFLKDLQKTYEIYGRIKFDVYKRELITSADIELEIEHDSISERELNIVNLLQCYNNEIHSLFLFKKKYLITNPETSNQIKELDHKREYLTKLLKSFWKEDETQKYNKDKNDNSKYDTKKLRINKYKAKIDPVYNKLKKDSNFDSNHCQICKLRFDLCECFEENNSDDDEYSDQYGPDDLDDSNDEDLPF